MTRNDIIRMAREAGFVERNAHSDIIVRHSNGSWVSVHDLLENFATLVADAEHEACALLHHRGASVELRRLHSINMELTQALQGMVDYYGTASANVEALESARAALAKAEIG